MVSGLALSLQSDLVTDMYIALSSILSAKRVRGAHRLEARVFGQPRADVPGRPRGRDVFPAGGRHADEGSRGQRPDRAQGGGRGGEEQVVVPDRRGGLWGAGRAGGGGGDGRQRWGPRCRLLLWGAAWTTWLASWRRTGPQRGSPSNPIQRRLPHTRTPSRGTQR